MLNCRAESKPRRICTPGSTKGALGDLDEITLDTAPLDLAD